jgi:hypothetical protein
VTCVGGRTEKGCERYDGRNEHVDMEKSRDISQEGMKGIVRKGFEAIAGAMERVMNGIGERMVQEKKRRDMVTRGLEERIQGMENRDFNERKMRERENRGREERLLVLEQKMEDQEKKRQRGKMRLMRL